MSECTRRSRQESGRGCGAKLMSQITGGAILGISLDQLRTVRPTEMEMDDEVFLVSKICKKSVRQ